MCKPRIKNGLGKGGRAGKRKGEKKTSEGGLVSEETVVLRRWGSETRKFGLSTELIM